MLSILHIGKIEGQGPTELNVGEFGLVWIFFFFIISLLFLPLSERQAILDGIPVSKDCKAQTFVLF